MYLLEDQQGRSDHPSMWFLFHCDNFNFNFTQTPDPVLEPFSSDIQNPLTMLIVPRCSHTFDASNGAKTLNSGDVLIHSHHLESPLYHH